MKKFLALLLINLALFANEKQFATIFEKHVEQLKSSFSCQKMGKNPVFS
ncbi:MAG: hypothetical protein MRY21_02945 [Simkaniaceae bacterium]|nr:hypothetical protein [Simkaniaceae bacterium]